jgi:putative oxidoreductase
MELALLIGRILFGGYFLYSGINHFMNLSTMSQYTAMKGVPAPMLAVAGTGLLLVLGGLSILIGAWPRWGALLIAIFLLGVSPMMHNFWAATDPQARMADMGNFMKNMALLGAALMMMWMPQRWPYSAGGERR